ncbi:MAG: MotA/TolQ/ExbB proton channel family protein [Pseudotabrizicola sp.]|uniref:MotA/TolQ/ExbB proton channel family protein n=1 Tax=Pseudotabrizicola sp. TaxID=2939647 RepID=UPI002728388E|nr:MotA/TolQ/ExbB proton channel family protein [Pseudotabrizicola sp.]MDO8884534.1 MotA/TolQ/ExbB proton channel family protein [Pseudotabrizicola sp.]MDP2080474.1 MotA/TolQ/ExbB proton channel family protein [Pseudotabrizicola sp.]MDZ7573681.1 MotA/TolQ/ExbB proton channel family protein [Pseudotabrizicola sp.]
MEQPITPAPPALQDGYARLIDFVAMGGPAMWAIAVLSVLTVALILWKVMRLLSFGAWSGGRHTAHALDLWAAGQAAQAIAMLASRSSLRARLALAAMQFALNPALDQTAAEAETGRVARGLLARARAGLRGLELAATIGPLLGLLGTVTGMIVAFQALQEAGSRADPAALAGGIWEALLTTAAGMAVAIPASIALTWFESVVDGLRHDMEDSATRILHGARAVPVSHKAAE